MTFNVQSRLYLKQLEGNIPNTITYNRLLAFKFVPQPEKNKLSVDAVFVIFYSKQCYQKYTIAEM